MNTIGIDFRQFRDNQLMLILNHNILATYYMYLSENWLPNEINGIEQNNEMNRMKSSWKN